MKDPNEYRPGYKETKVGRIPVPWRFDMLESVSTRETGHTPNREHSDYWGGGVAWLSLALHRENLNPKVILVTDRIDLDNQIGGTFRACGLEPEQANTGKHLVELLTDERTLVVTTLIRHPPRHRTRNGQRPRVEIPLKEHDTIIDRCIEVAIANED